MKIQHIVKVMCVGVIVVTMAACSSKNKGGAGGMGDGNGAYGNGSGAYSEGMGSGSGFSDGQNCDVPQNGRTQAYYFDFDSNAVNAGDRDRLRNLAGNLKTNHQHVQVVGNTDNRGSREYNVALGWRRADAVASTLEQYGVSKQQITTNSNGAEKPVAYGSSEGDFQCNRRVDAKS